jgi:psiF repeat
MAFWILTLSITSAPRSLPGETNCEIHRRRTAVKSAAQNPAEASRLAADGHGPLIAAERIGAFYSHKPTRFLRYRQPNDGFKIPSFAPPARGNRMKRYLIAVAMIAALIAPASAQLTSQQQRMKDCNTQASGMSGDARKQFMSSCLSGAAAETKGPHCTKGKPCGNSCIAMDKVCHK